jgi:DNA polymerase-4
MTATDRHILHVDMNCFYAAVECLHRPEIRKYPVVVGGHEELRHGIVLAKNLLAKRAGVKTGEALWEARRKCPALVVIPPSYRLYQDYSRRARMIYYDYSPCVEPFGLDEAWIDVTGSLHLFGGDVDMVCREISERVKAELGLTVSIGASWNKIFAKFGSDYKKPDAITHITCNNYQSIVWRSPVAELLYVGPSTRRKLHTIGIDTIGQLATSDASVMRSLLGKVGETLLVFARGEDRSKVKEFDLDKADVGYEIKSIGNGLTAPHDLVSIQDTKALIYLLAESVAQRLRECSMRTTVIAIHVRDSDLYSYSRQMSLPTSTCLSTEIAQAAFELVAKNEALDGSRRLRSLGVRATGLVRADEPMQLDIFGDRARQIQREDLEHTIDALRARFGNRCVCRAITVADRDMAALDIKADNVIHPVGYFNP